MMELFGEKQLRGCPVIFNIKIGLGLKYNLASKYTSFVGVDEKQGKSDKFMITRHVKIQMPQNTGSYSGYGGTRSASYAIVYTAPKIRGYMAPPGAAFTDSDRTEGFKELVLPLQD